MSVARARPILVAALLAVLAATAALAWAALQADPQAAGLTAEITCCGFAA